jgi:hypothetical protein
MTIPTRTTSLSPAPHAARLSNSWCASARLPPAAHRLHRQIRGLLPEPFVAEKLVALGEHRHQWPQLRVLLRQGAGDLLRAELGQPLLALRDSSTPTRPAESKTP